MPLVAVAAIGDFLWTLEPMRNLTVLEHFQHSRREFLFISYLVVCGVTLWLTILGAICWRWPHWVRLVFHPFADQFNAAWGKRLFLSGLTAAVIVIGLALTVAIR